MIKNFRLNPILTIIIPIIGSIVGIFITFSFNTSNTITASINPQGFILNWINIFVHNSIFVLLLYFLGLTAYIGNTLLILYNFIVFSSSVTTALLQHYNLLILYGHSFFEIPAILISYYLSLSLSERVIIKIFDPTTSVFANLVPPYRITLLCIILLITGSGIESALLNFLN